MEPDFEELQKVIDDELKIFDQRGKAETANYYGSLMEHAHAAPGPERRRAPPVPPGAPFKGNPDAKVVIQEWGDLDCPFSSRVEGAVAEVMREYGDEVKFVWRDRPHARHTDALLAGEAAREALEQKGPDAFWKMHERIFESHKLRREDLEAYAEELGLDEAKFKSALDRHVHRAELDTDEQAGAAIGVHATPTFLDNGYYVIGAQPYHKLKKLIDRALAETR